MDIESLEEYSHVIIETRGVIPTWIFDKEEFIENEEELTKDAVEIYLAKKIKR